jgi:GNAT superfamily N-acetyltransferase
MHQTPSQGRDCRSRLSGRTVEIREWSVATRWWRMVSRSRGFGWLRANSSVLVLELDGDILGFSRYGASRDPDAGPETGEVIALNLHPSWWRRGLGRELLRETQQRLRGRGFSEATLWVLHGNASARQFYEALGWRLDGVEKHDDKLTGFALHEVRYRVALP